MIVAVLPTPHLDVAHELRYRRADRKWAVWLRDGYLWCQRNHESEGMTAWADMYARAAAVQDRRISEIDEQIARLQAMP
jgi:hypothetical protein